MANNILKIKFNAPAQEGDLVQVLGNPPFTTMTFSYGFNGTILTTGNIASDANVLKNYITNNYGSIYEAVVVNDEEVVVTETTNTTNFSIISNLSNGRIETTIQDTPDFDDIKIDNVQITGSCGFYNLAITTNYVATSLLEPVVINNNTENPIIPQTSFLRDDVNRKNIKVRYDDGTYLSEDETSIYVPNIVPANFNVSVLQTATNNTVNVTNTFNDVPSITIEYSLDDINYSQSSVFSGLGVGSYNVFIKDSLGCKISIPFEVESFDPNVYDRKPVFEFSEMSSFIYVARDNNRKTYKNTMSYEERNSYLYVGCQPFQKDDGILTTQFKTTYETVVAELYKCNGELVNNLPVSKVSNLINIVDTRDAFLNSFDYNGSKYVGIQYKGGNVYNEDGTVKETYFNDSTIPYFMNKGDNINVEGLWFKVIDVVTYNNQQTLILNLLEISAPFDLNKTYKVTSHYNIQDFDFFEFYVDPTLLDGDYQIKVKATDSKFEELNFLTEKFNVSDYQKNSYNVVVYNTYSNLNTWYGNNARFRLRIPYQEPLEYAPQEEIENFSTDNNVVNIESITRSIWSLKTMNLITNYARKINAITTNNRIFVEGQSYVKSQDTEQTKLGVTNTYFLNIFLQEADYVYSNSGEGGQTRTVLGTGVQGTALGVGY